MRMAHGFLAAALMLPIAAFICGCSTSFDPSPTPLIATAAIGPIHGNVHGGIQPVVGAHVYLYAASTAGYGAASTSLLTSVTGGTYPTVADGAGHYYETTDTNGAFNLTGDYTCVSGTQVYLYAVGGNPGAGVNSAASFMAVLGQCPASGSLAAQVPSLYVNEATTVAAAYAMAGFAADATHVGSSGTALALTGIANAFANAGNLTSITSGAALAVTPSGNGTVPKSTIYTIANILAACVNSVGGVCTTLFTNAHSKGQVATLSSVVPTETASAAIFIAQNPGTNVANLYPLASSTGPFQPSLSTKPNDFTIGINFTGGGLNYPESLAVDVSGNIWVTDGGASAVTELSSSGVSMSGNSGYSVNGGASGIVIDKSGNIWLNQSSKMAKLSGTDGSLLSPTGGYTGLVDANYGLAVDGKNDVWVLENSPINNVAEVMELSNSGSIISNSGSGPYSTGGNSTSAPVGIGFDGAGNAWIANDNGESISKLSSSGTLLSNSGSGPWTGGGQSDNQCIAVDSAGSAWLCSGEVIVKISNSGTFLSGTTGFSTGANLGPESIALDGSGNAWIGNQSNEIFEFSNSGTAITSSTGYTGGILTQPLHVAIDGSGNLWVVNETNTTNSITEMVGVATPVVTPIAAGLPTIPTSNGTSNLGTRP